MKAPLKFICPSMTDAKGRPAFVSISVETIQDLSDIQMLAEDCFAELASETEGSFDASATWKLVDAAGRRFVSTRNLPFGSKKKSARLVPA